MVFVSRASLLVTACVLVGYASTNDASMVCVTVVLAGSALRCGSLVMPAAQKL